VQPDTIDEDKARAARESMVKNNVIYGGAFEFEFVQRRWMLIMLCR
jgi:hypothetical protein